MSQRQLFLFGAPRIVAGGARIALPRRKALALLAYLAATGTPHTRESLAALLWGDSDDQSANAYLRNALWTLNKSLGSDWIDADGGTISLNSAAIQVDVRAFVAFSAEAMRASGPERLKRTALAMEIYAGEFMAGFNLPDASEFTNWQISMTESLQRSMIGILMLRADEARIVNDLFAATDAAQRWLTLDPLNERAARTMMQVLAEAGEINAAVRQYHDLKRRLREALNVSPEAKTVALFESLTSRPSSAAPEIQVTPSRSAPKFSDASDRETMSAQRLVSESGQERGEVAIAVGIGEAAPYAEAVLEDTYLVGRDDERQSLLALLNAPAVHLVTIVAPGGMGKSILAQQISVDIRRNGTFADGVYWVSFAPLCSSDAILSTIAAALPYPLGGGLDLESRLVSTLANKQMLFVLDNFEHVLDGAPIVSRLLNAAPGIKTLITSRERLNLRNERVFELHGLSVPGPREDPLRTPFDAIDLFQKRAQQAGLGFTMNSQNASDIARICRLVEGMPLALELAASWTPLLSCAEIVREIETNLDFLTSPTRDMPERHRSLRAVFASSWEQMTPDEQHILAVLAIFRGGFRLEAASSVAGASPRVLLSLVNKSLLKRRDDGRFEIHELLRQFAEGMLDPEARLDAVDRHATYFASLMQTEGIRLKSREQRAALDTLQAEIDNVRIAWRHALARRKLDALDKMIEPLLMFCRVRSRFDDLPDMIATAAEQLPSETPLEQALMARVLVATANLHIRVRHKTVIDGIADRAIELLRRFSDQPGMGLWLVLAGGLRRRPGRVQPEAEELINAGLRSLEREGDIWGIGYALYEFGTLQHMQMRYAEARETLNRSLYYFEKVGQPLSIAFVFEMLAENMQTLGNYDAARDYYSRQIGPLRELGMLSEAQNVAVGLEMLSQRGRLTNITVIHEGLERLRAAGDRRGEAWALYNLGWIHYFNQNYPEAERILLDSLRTFMALGDDEGILWSNIYLAEVALESGRRTSMQTYIDGARRTLAEIDFPWGEAGLEYTLGNQALYDGDTQAARKHYRQAVSLAHGAQSVMQTLRHLAGIADIWQRDEQPEDALTLLTFILENPTSWDDTRRRARQIIDALLVLLPPKTAAKLQAAGRALSLDEAVIMALR